MPVSRTKRLCGYNGRYIATHSINRNAAYTNRKSIKIRSCDYIDGLVDCYLTAIEVLCNIDGIGGEVTLVDSLSNCNHMHLTPFSHTTAGEGVTFVD